MSNLHSAVQSCQNLGLHMLNRCLLNKCQVHLNPETLHITLCLTALFDSWTHPHLRAFV